MNNEVKKHISIISLLSKKGFLSMNTSMSAYEDIRMKFKMTRDELLAGINEVSRSISAEDSCVSLDVAFKDGEIQYYTK